MKNSNFIISIVLIFLFALTPAAMAIDPPSNVASSTHTVGVSSTNDTITITWTAPADSTLNSYAILLDNSPDTLLYTGNRSASATSATPAALADGDNWYFHITAIDNDGKYSESVHLGPFIIDTMPSVSSVEPSSGASGDSITITGTDFMSGATAKIGDTSVSTVRFVSSTELEATVPAEISTGKYDITVTNSNGKSGKKEDCFSVSSASVEVDAGSDKEITVGGSDPSFSDADVSDTDENATYLYEWTVNSAPSAAELGTDYILGSARSQTSPTTVSFKAKTNNAAGSYTLNLSVKDGTTGKVSGSDTLTITVYMFGDINGDSSLDVADAIMGLKVLADMDVSGIPPKRAATGPVIGMAEVIYILVEISGS
ncbi:IPT/TIG domain-containing protein [Desulfobacterales bacterium HSG2]|nr:IPT/TIG domain-containing protein [Desulfobacterales bacterium HSG2]